MDLVEMKITARTSNCETVSLDGFQMLATRNERYRVTASRQSRIEISSDTTGSDNSNSHLIAPLYLVGRIA
jgi:hypothetical protein